MSIRFWRERLALSSLRCSFVPKLLSWGIFEEKLTIVLEWCNGVSLYEALQPLMGREASRKVPASMRVKLAAYIGHTVCGFLKEVHRMGYVHRDVKPRNLIGDSNGDIRLIDLGLCQRVAEPEESPAWAFDCITGDLKLTETRHIVGTPLYASPEQLRNLPLNGQSDVFSLAVMLYEILTADSPYGGTSAFMRCIQKISTDGIGDPRESNAEIPEEFARLIVHAGRRIVAQRATLEELREGLGRFISPDSSLILGQVVREALADKGPS